MKIITNTHNTHFTNLKAGDLYKKDAIYYLVVKLNNKLVAVDLSSHAVEELEDGAIYVYTDFSLRIEK